MKFNPLISKCKKAYQEVNKDDEESQNNVEHVKEENGTVLTIIFWIFLILCCSSWTLTAWFSAQKCDSCSKIPNQLRFDCHPDEKISQEACLARNCCWNPPKSYQEKDEVQNTPPVKLFFELKDIVELLDF